MQHLEGQVIWPADTASDGAGLTLTLTVQLRDVALQDAECHAHRQQQRQQLFDAQHHGRGRR